MKNIFFVLYFSDDYMVRVNAQVMTRDDSAGGWNPIKGGIAVVGLRKQLVLPCETDDPQHEYLIHGQRIKDQSVSHKVLYLSFKWCKRHTGFNKRTTLKDFYLNLSKMEEVGWC